jgi:arsenate reductase
MAEGFLKAFDPTLEVYSAGTKPAQEINPLAVKVMEEVGIDISKQYPKDVEEFIEKEFDYVITVCDNAKETSPVFTGKVKNRLHIGFEDPAEAQGSENEVIEVYRKVRDEIHNAFWKLYTEQLRK